MKRGETGRYEVTAVGGEVVRAFVPSALPPAPPLVFEGALQQALEAAVLAIGRLDGVSTLLPDSRFSSMPMFVRRLCCRPKSKGPSRHSPTYYSSKWMKLPACRSMM